MEREQDRVAGSDPRGSGGRNSPFADGAVRRLRGGGRFQGSRWLPWSLLGLLAYTAGCATVGHEFSPARVPQITIGQTTKSDIRLMFGEPYRRGIDDGDSTWTYVHYKFRLFGEHMKTRDLLIRWDKEERVRSYSYNSNMD